jgi:hypothetical protein
MNPNLRTHDVMNNRPSRRRGRAAGDRYSAFTVLEMLLVLSLMMTISLLATRLFRSTLHLTRHAGEAAAIIARFDSALDVLRADVWSASAIDTPDARSVRLAHPDGAVITWRYAAPGRLVRVVTAPHAPEARRTWTHLDLAMTFGVQEGTLAIRVPDTPAHSGGESRFFSQLLRAKGALPGFRHPGLCPRGVEGGGGGGTVGDGSARARLLRWWPLP